MFFHKGFNEIDKVGVGSLVILTLKVAKGSLLVLRCPNDLWFLTLRRVWLVFGYRWGNVELVALFCCFLRLISYLEILPCAFESCIICFVYPHLMLDFWFHFFYTFRFQNPISSFYSWHEIFYQLRNWRKIFMVLQETPFQQREDWSSLTKSLPHITKRGVAFEMTWYGVLVSNCSSKLMWCLYTYVFFALPSVRFVLWLLSEL